MIKQQIRMKFHLVMMEVMQIIQQIYWFRTWRNSYRN